MRGMRAAFLAQPAGEHFGHQRQALGFFRQDHDVVVWHGMVSTIWRSRRWSVLPLLLRGQSSTRWIADGTA